MNDFDAINLVLLLARVLLGFTMFAHGYQKVFKGGKLPGTAGWFDSIGMKPGMLHARMAATTEMGSGILLAAGLLTSLAGAAYVALMIVAAWTVHRANGFFIVKSGWEYNMVLAVAGVLIGTVGAGKYSLDHAFDFVDTFSGSSGLLMSLGVGVLGGIGQLVVFFRPPAAAE